MKATTMEHLLDVRPLPPCAWHTNVFGTWTKLAPGDSILLVIAADTAAIYHRFAAEHAGAFRWENLEQRPDLTRVRITKGDFADPGFVPAARSAPDSFASDPAPTGGVAPLVLDTRPIFASGETPCQAIDDAVARLLPGQAFVLLVPFEPVPLYAKLGKQGFVHQEQTLGDGTWQVQFRKTG